MSKNDQVISGPLLAVVLLGGSYLARKGIAQAWTGVTSEPPPADQNNNEVELSEAVTWGVVSGVAVGILKFALRRANYKGSPLD